MEEKKYPIGYYAPGNYQCKCWDCGGSFLGDKRAVQCEPCAVANKQKFDALSPDEQKELMQRNAEAIREVFKNWAQPAKPYINATDTVTIKMTNMNHPMENKVAVWVKATDRLPGIRTEVKWRIDGNEWQMKETVLGMWYNKPNVNKYEWLDEQPVEQKENEAVGWIDVNDRLPELETKVIVLRPNEYSKKNDVLMAYLHDSGETGRSHGRLGESKWLYGFYWSLPAIVEFNTITHWMPLPETEPYQKQNKR